MADLAPGSNTGARNFPAKIDVLIPTLKYLARNYWHPGAKAKTPLAGNISGQVPGGSQKLTHRRAKKAPDITYQFLRRRPTDDRGPGKEEEKST